jgi:general secretion pathway protein C
VTQPPAKTGEAILSRNPFDSVTGALTGRPEPEEQNDTPEPVAVDATDEDPNCTVGKVLLISASEDPQYSFAAIDQGGGSKLMRLGDSVGSHTVQAFGWDRVWLAEGKSTCQLKLGESGGAAPAAKAKTAAPAPGRRGASQLSPEMASKITKVSETEYTIERSVVDEILENQAELMKSARIVPEKEGDKVVGIRLFGIRNGTLLNHLGMQNGDRLESINGFNMSDPQKALEAYGRLRTADSLKVQMNRKGAPVTLELKIQ